VPTIHDHLFAEIDALTFHDIVKLRVDVFVVEQACAYPELDGRDTKPATRHVWVSEPDSGRPIAYLRMLAEPGATRVGRVTTRADHRNEGLAGMLIDHAIATAAGDVVLDAQLYLVDWYSTRGFEATGPEFLDDGIPHVPMIRHRSTDR